MLVLLFFPVYLSGHEGARLAYQVAALAVLGLWLNTLVTEVDLVNLSQGHAAPPAENPQRWLLLGFVGAATLLFGQVWCGYLCPFGAAQELVSRLGRRLGLRAYPERHLEQGVRCTQVRSAGGDAGGGLGDGRGGLGHLQPHAARLRRAVGWRGWMPWLTVLVLVACLFHYRFWCRYFCPHGGLPRPGQQAGPAPAPGAPSGASSTATWG